MGGWLKSFTLAGFLALSGWADTPESILQKKCGTCHSGPFLDLRNAPFKWSEAKTPQDFAAGMLGRVRTEGWKKMPPVNAPPLTCKESLELENWAKRFGL